MPASKLIVGIRVGEFVEQQQIADQKEGDERDQQGCPGECAGQAEEGAVDHQGAKAEAGRDEAQDGLLVEPGGVGDDHKESQRAESQNLPAVDDGKVDADGHADGAADDGSPQRVGQFFGVGHDGSAATAERGAGGLEIQAAFNVFIFIEGIDRAVGQNAAHETQNRLPDVDGMAAPDSCGQSEENTGNRQG